jgi:CRISPR-associated protein (TIGR03984 family)
MAQTESTNVNVKVFISRAEGKTLGKAVTEYHKNFGEGLALLYSPKACWLAKLESDGSFVASRGKEDKPMALASEDLQSVFEARVFNAKAELRWLNEVGGSGAAVVLCVDDAHNFFGMKPVLFKTKINDEEKELIDTIEQTYLLWGQSVGAATGDWTQFAEARIGSFFVPLKDVTAPNKRARFTAIEYLGEYEDGNVAVAEERLTGIEIV